MLVVKVRYFCSLVCLKSEVIWPQDGSLALLVCSGMSSPAIAASSQGVGDALCLFWNFWESRWWVVGCFSWVKWYVEGEAQLERERLTGTEMISGGGRPSRDSR